MVESSRYCYEDFEKIDEKAAKKNLRPVILEAFRDVRDRFAALPEWTEEALHDAIETCADAHEIKLGKLS